MDIFKGMTVQEYFSDVVIILDSDSQDEVDPPNGTQTQVIEVQDKNDEAVSKKKGASALRLARLPSRGGSAMPPRKGIRLIMEEDAPNHVEAVECIDDEDDPDGDEKRPIMLLLRRLIRNKQNTVMTNAQIVDILESEFGIDVKTSHELEVDIYIKIIKKYLKDWPQWEELERISTKLSNIKDFEAISKVLNHKYKNLKEYLGVMLEATKPLAKEAVKSVTKDTNTNKIEENIDSSDVVMEIQCTREQLNHLFFRRPRLDLNNTVFNMSTIEPSRIQLKTFTFEEILKAGWTKIYINLPNFTYTRELAYVLKHVLVNKARNDNSSKDISLSTDLQMKAFKKSKNHPKNEICKQFNEILKECLDICPMMNTVFNILKEDLNYMNSYKIPANYRGFVNKYKYVRYLYAENENSNDPRYDLQLEETVSPSLQFYIGKIGKLQKPLPPITDWFKIECMICKIKFNGASNIAEGVEGHFNHNHQNEPEWQCTHCKRPFSLDYLAQHNWCHDC